MSQDDLDRRVQEAVAAALTKERETVARAAAGAHRIETLGKLESQLSDLRKLPGTAWGLAVRRARLTFLIAGFLLLGGVTVPFSFLLGSIGASPTAALICPLHCDGCSGPGRQFNWRYRGSWSSNKGTMGSALVCSHPSLPLEQMTWTDVKARNDELQPYIVHFLVVHLVDSLVLATLLALLFGAALGGGRGRLKRIAAEREDLERRVRALGGAV